MYMIIIYYQTRGGYLLQVMLRHTRVNKNNAAKAAENVKYNVKLLLIIYGYIYNFSLLNPHQLFVYEIIV